MGKSKTALGPAGLIFVGFAWVGSGDNKPLPDAAPAQQSVSVGRPKFKAWTPPPATLTLSPRLLALPK